MLFEVLTAKEYSQLMGYDPRGGRVSQIIRSGVWPPHWIREPRKSGGTWLIYVLKSWYDEKISSF